MTTIKKLREDIEGLKKSTHSGSNQWTKPYRRTGNLNTGVKDQEEKNLNREAGKGSTAPNSANVKNIRLATKEKFLHQQKSLGRGTGDIGNQLAGLEREKERRKNLNMDKG
jgi:hypothetical protein